MLLRKSFTSGPLRLTISRRGVGASLGTNWWRVQRQGRRESFTLRVPGTGISIRRSGDR